MPKTKCQSQMETSSYRKCNLRATACSFEFLWEKFPQMRKLGSGNGVRCHRCRCSTATASATVPTATMQLGQRPRHVSHLGRAGPQDPRQHGLAGVGPAPEAVGIRETAPGQVTEHMGSRGLALQWVCALGHSERNKTNEQDSVA